MASREGDELVTLEFPLVPFSLLWDTQTRSREAFLVNLEALHGRLPALASPGGGPTALWPGAQGARAAHVSSGTRRPVDEILGTALKPWKPVVGIYRGVSIPGFDRWCRFSSIHSMGQIPRVLWPSRARSHHESGGPLGTPTSRACGLNIAFFPLARLPIEQGLDFGWGLTLPTRSLWWRGILAAGVRAHKVCGLRVSGADEGHLDLRALAPCQAGRHGHWVGGGGVVGGRGQGEVGRGVWAGE